MSDIASNPRLHELLELARNATQLHEEMSQRGEVTVEVDDAMVAIYADIGKLVSRLMSESSAGIPDPETPTGPLITPLSFEPIETSNADERSTFIPTSDDFADSVNSDASAPPSSGWYTEEVEFDTSQPLFSASDNLEEYTDIPESDPETAEVPMADLSVDEEYEISQLAQMIAHRAEMGHPLHNLASQDEDPTWTHRLTQLLGLLNLPDDFTGRDQMAVEASRVQWAANELGRRLDGLPESIQICLIGMLAARAQHLRSQLDDDVGPRLALDRLRSYRIDTELPTVAGLVAQPFPETGTWVGDIHQWWALLQPAAPIESVD